MTRRIACLLASVGTLGCFASSAVAITIDFGAKAGYSPTGGEGGAGNLKGQPATAGATQWTGGVAGKDTAILVVPGAKADGTNQALVTQAGSPAVPSATYSFLPSSGDLGGDFDPASSVVYFGFRFRVPTVAKSFGTNILRIRIGGPYDGKSAACFGLSDNGVLVATNGDGGGNGSMYYTTTTPGGTTKFNAAPNVEVTVAGKLNYSTKTFTYSVNGVAQTDKGNAEFHFRSNEAPNARFDLLNFNADNPLWVPTVIDYVGLSLKPLPEPPPPAVAAVPAFTPKPEEMLPAGTNLVKNSSFENPPGASYFWNQNNWAHNDVEFALDPDNPHSGHQAQRVSLRKATGATASVQFATPPLPVRPGMSLQLRCWLRGLPNTRPITVSLRQNGPPYTVYFQGEISLDKDWTESVFTMTLPANVDLRNTSLMFELKEENTYWLDDVTLTVMPAEEPGTPLVGNQLKNGSFEVGKDFWYAGFRFGNNNPAEEEDAAATIEAKPEDNAPNGRKVLAWETFVGARADLTSAYFHLRYGHPASIRFWLKSSAPGKVFSVSLGQGKFPNQIVETQTFTPVNAGWNFYHATVTPKPSNSGTYYLEIVTDKAGKYELDGVSVVEGTAAEPTFVARPVELGWGTADGTPAGNLFYAGNAAHEPLCAATSEAGSSLLIHLRVVDYRENEVKSWDVSVPLDDKGHGQVDVALPSDRFGGFKVEAFTAAGWAGKVPDGELLYSVVPRLKPLAESADSFFGGHVDFTPYNLAIAERLGMRWLRLNPPLSTRWMTVEKKQGTFEFDTKGVARARDMGFQILGLFATVPYFYADGDSQKVRGSTWYSSFPPADWDAWRGYVQKTAAAFAPYVQAWEVWNEPDGAFMQVRPGVEKEPIYVKLVQQTRQALDEAGIKTFVIGNVAASIDRHFTLKELQLGGGKEVDALSFHLYNEDRGPEEKQPPLANQVAQMRAFPNRSGAVPEIWITESGIWLSESRSWLDCAEVPTGVATTIADATNTITRTLAGLKAMGIRRYFHYAALTQPSGRIVYRDECSGIIDINGIPHAAGAAYAATVHFLEDAQPLGLEVKATEQGPATEALFKTSSGTVAVVWARHPVKLGQVPSLDWQKSSGFDLMGNPVSLSADMPVTLDPLYLVEENHSSSPAEAR